MAKKKMPAFLQKKIAAQKAAPSKPAPVAGGTHAKPVKGKLPPALAAYMQKKKGTVKKGGK